MTVCIAAINEADHAIVTVNDTMLADDTGAVDFADFKLAWLVHDDRRGVSWRCLYAGLPTVFRTVTEHVQAAIGNSLARSCAEVMRAVENAYDAVINRRIEREVLAQMYGIDFAKFSKLRRGPHREGIEARIFEANAAIRNEMLYVGVPTTLLVFGFDAQRDPHIFSTDGIGKCTSHDDIGYYAIGVGADAARAWLLATNDFRHAKPVSTTAFRLLEAKFLAENSPFVGKVTLLHVWSKDHLSGAIVVSPSSGGFELQSVRNVWQRRVNQPPPDGILIGINDAIKRYSRPSVLRRMIMHAHTEEIARRRFDEASALLEDALAMVSATPPNLYRHEIFTALQQSARRAEALRLELTAMFEEWRSIGVRPASFDEVAIAFDVEKEYIAANCTNTITPLEDAEQTPFDQPQTASPEPSKE